MSRELSLPYADSVALNPLGRIHRQALLGTGLIALFILGGGVWAGIAPLASGAVAPGVVEVETTRKTVQHLEGGIIGSILVHEGDRVQAGQVLIRLDTTKPAAALEQLQADAADLDARIARLDAEQRMAETILWPDALRAQPQSPQVQAVMAGQQQIFDMHRLLLKSKIAAIEQKNDRAREEIKGLEAQASGIHRQNLLILEERRGVQELVDKGLEKRPRLLALDRNTADLDGRAGDLAGQIARARQTLDETGLETLNLRNDQLAQASEQLREAEQKRADLRGQLATAQDQLSRTEITAPVGGIVTDLKVHTAGGVIQSGEALLDLVPEADRLIIAAELRPDDIEGVHPGLPVHIRLPAYKQRTQPDLKGVVLTVAADRLIDKRTNQPYYATRIALDPASAAGLQLVAGMQADSVIETGKTTVALYALSPILDTLNRAFRDK